MCQSYGALFGAVIGRAASTPDDGLKIVALK